MLVKHDDGGMDLEIVRWHCKGKKAHKTKASRNKHKAHGCTPAKPHSKKHAVAARGRGPAGGGLHGGPGHP